MEQQQQQGKFNRERRGQFPAKPKDEFDSVVLDLARVTRVTKGGKQMRFRAVVVVGNKKGKIGLGVAKGPDVAIAVEKSTRLAKKNIISVPMFEETIPHEVLAKYGPARRDNAPSAVWLRHTRKAGRQINGGLRAKPMALYAAWIFASSYLKTDRYVSINATVTSEGI